MKDIRQIIVVRKDLGMPPGKLAAQVAHASMKVLLDQMQRTGPSIPRGQVLVLAAWLFLSHFASSLHTLWERAGYPVLAFVAFMLSAAGLLVAFWILGKRMGSRTQDLHLENPSPELLSWVEGSFTKICVQVKNETELNEVLQRAKDAGLPCALIVDSGRTVFGGVPTATCCAIGPATPEKLDPVTGNLKLL